ARPRDLLRVGDAADLDQWLLEPHSPRELVGAGRQGGLHRRAGSGDVGSVFRTLLRGDGQRFECAGGSHESGQLQKKAAVHHALIPPASPALIVALSGLFGNDDIAPSPAQVNPVPDAIRPYAARRAAFVAASQRRSSRSPN